MKPPIPRRAVLGGLAALATSACGRESRGQSAAPPPDSLKAAAGFPVGCAVTRQRLADPLDAALIARHFSQLTPEWELKMEYVLAENGDLRFEAPDAIADFATAHGQRLFGHTLVWYVQNPAAFARLDGQNRAFADAFRAYILAVVGRYRDRIAGWDVVNEAVAEDGQGLRDSLWSRNLGSLDHMRRAFDHAREADPSVRLFINDYNLESLPGKRASFLRLAESLLKAGAPLGGLGSQTHLAADLPPGAMTRCLRDLASLGLPIHVSELDISLNRAHAPFASRQDLAAARDRLAREAAETFASLPPAQRFAFTLWGLRDGESWLRSPKENPAPPWDAPLAFDDAGRPGSMLAALAAGFRGR